ncbi:DUF6368 family protein [Neobacillus sp. NRS-1170]|uniref:DUF6368 family protein n=1 Tax=Neobacillus sp. NRS-1170 TaxID=3233898 RepID=UPI003D2B377C
MSGPAVGILLKEPLSNNETDELYQFIKNCSSSHEIDLDNALSFWISDATPLGLSYKGFGLPFVIGIEEEFLVDFDMDSIHQAIRFIPKQEIDIVAMCNGSDDHYILAKLAIILAEKYDGIINMDYELPKSLTNRITGSIWKVPYLTIGDEIAFVHFVDVTFLKNWLKEPNFRI